MTEEGDAPKSTWGVWTMFLLQASTQNSGVMLGFTTQLDVLSQKSPFWFGSGHVPSFFLLGSRLPMRNGLDWWERGSKVPAWICLLNTQIKRLTRNNLPAPSRSLYAFPLFLGAWLDNTHVVDITYASMTQNSVHRYFASPWGQLAGSELSSTCTHGYVFLHREHPVFKS